MVPLPKKIGIPSEDEQLVLFSLNLSDENALHNILHKFSDIETVRHVLGYDLKIIIIYLHNR